MKQDKGFQLIYWKLSYRRKFIRTLWLIPLIFASSLFIWFKTYSLIFTLICFSIMVISEIFQAIYTYKKWKNGEENTF